MPVQVLAALLPGHLPVNGPRKVARYSRAWTPATNVGAHDGSPRSWLWLGPVLAVVVIGGVSQQMEDLTVGSPSHSGFGVVDI